MGSAVKIINGRGALERNLRVSKKDEGLRLDKWLTSQLPGQSRKQIKAMLDSGLVIVNGRRVVIAGWELAEGDEIELRKGLSIPRERGEGEPPRPAPRSEGGRDVGEIGSKDVADSIERHLARRKDRRKRSKHAKPRKEPIRVKVYHQDKDVIVVEKPGGILSVPKEKNDKRENMLELVRRFLRRKYRKGKASFVSPLHRLDAETSGVMVFALSKNGQRLTEQFRNHSIQRSYEAIVLGRIEKEQGTIDAPLEKGDFGGGRKSRRSGGPGSKRAVTEYRVKERYGKATLLDVRVRTGRTHQIRVHLASEGYPVLGDSVYAEEMAGKEPEVMDEIDRTLGFRRHALHAATLSFKHPANGRKMKFRSQIPDDMKELVDWLREKG